MLDVNLLRTDTEKYARLLSTRSDEKVNLKPILELDDKRKELQATLDTERANNKKATEEFQRKMQELPKDSAEKKKLQADLKDAAKKVKKGEAELRNIKEELEKKVSLLPNIPFEDVPAGDKDQNQVVKTWGDKPKLPKDPKNHLELGEALGILDFKTPANMAGAQFSMYKGDGARLIWALITWLIDWHQKEGCEFIIPPHLLNEQSVYCAGQLPKFKDDVYHIDRENLYLLPTAETALVNMHRDQILDEKDLPKKYAAYTPCYRQEAGGYGAKERGLMRIHQFHKVEMFRLTKPENSEESHQEMVEQAEKLVEALGLHYRTSLLSTKDMSYSMAKTYDIETWIPSMDGYIEVSSASNALDYQARRANTKFKTSDGKKKYVHMLNASGLATPRLMVALLESGQQEDGSIAIPKVLHKYFGKEKIEKK